MVCKSEQRVAVRTAAFCRRRRVEETGAKARSFSMCALHAGQAAVMALHGDCMGARQEGKIARAFARAGSRRFNGAPGWGMRGLGRRR